MTEMQPGLFGLNKSNRDFTQKEAWGKNQFNSSFPAALCCYLASKQIAANYLCIDYGKFTQRFARIDQVFGIDPLGGQIYFAFEAQHSPYQRFLVGVLPRTDLVIQRADTGECLAGLEVKLTALPDNTTCDLPEQDYGCELVVRPDTIAYLACSVASGLQNNLAGNIPEFSLLDWTKPKDILAEIPVLIETIEKISFRLEAQQKPFLIQPVWKTLGKSPDLAENCLDVFVWSDAAFCYFISQIANKNKDANGISRQTRTAVWLCKMLQDIKKNGWFNHEQIVDNLSYNTKNDKAFASAGNITNKYMRCGRLEVPVITKQEIKNIILGGGQNLLSPERRLDAIIFNSPGLFT
ncbi:MAG TPA: HindVP family restriction endonuclease [Methylomicrobium sp.]|nr:HindVP family restriction endonuclease [Methylomicrobium sp.]